MSAQLSRNKVHAKGSGTPPPSAGDPFFLKEIILQAKFGMGAYGDIRTRVDVRNDDLASFAFCQLMLGAAANVSKILFPPSKGKPATRRGQRLRNALGITAKDVIASRAARNYVEHFDEQLDRVFSLKGGVLGHRLILETFEDEIIFDGRRQPFACLQVIEMSSRTLILYDQRVSLDQLAAELTRVHDLAKAALGE
jgi:hypothetical protein